MSEKRNPMAGEMCADCPRRSRLSRLAAKLSLGNKTAENCEGPVTVSHGAIVTQVRERGEPSPPKSTWNSVSSNRDGVRKYNRNEWSTEVVCGTDDIEPRDGEVPFDPASPVVKVSENGKRYAAFIRGDEEQIRNQRFILAMSANSRSLEINPHD